jgi:hypothetical protein
MEKINVYFRGGNMDNDLRKMEWDYVSIADAPKTFSIHPFKFKLHHVNAIDGGLIYDCINDYMQVCNDCNGRGHTECPECEGTGEIGCDECDAQGWTETPEHKKARLKKEKELALEEAKRIEMMKNQLSLDIK